MLSFSTDNSSGSGTVGGGVGFNVGTVVEVEKGKKERLMTNKAEKEMTESFVFDTCAAFSFFVDLGLIIGSFLLVNDKE